MEAVFVKIASRIESFFRYMAVLGCIALVIAVLAVSADIVGRIIRIPVIGVEELNTLLIIMCVYLGIAFTQTRKKHISVTIIISRLPNLPKLILNNLILLFSLCFLTCFCYKSFNEAYRSFLIGEYVDGTVHFSVWPAKFVIAFGLALMSLQILIDLIRGVSDLIDSFKRKQQFSDQLHFN